MTTRRGTRQAREALDQRLNSLGPSSRFAIPRLGWIRAVRDALGMSAADLGARMGIDGASVRSLEDTEVTGGIRLSSLRRAAQAMDCTLVYAFLPSDSLEQTVRRQALMVQEQQLGRIRQTMALEDQEGDPGASSRDEQLRAIIDSGRLWSHVGAKR
jgi:predicted DNA-binding mobile mystery protein A